MNVKQRVVLMLNAEAAEKLDILTSPRKKGIFISELINSAYQRQYGGELIDLATELHQLADKINNYSPSEKSYSD